MTAAEPSGRSDALLAVIVVGALSGTLAAYIGLYVYMPIDSVVRLVAFAGMFVFLLVMLGLLILFARWWQGEG